MRQPTTRVLPSADGEYQITIRPAVAGVRFTLRSQQGHYLLPDGCRADVLIRIISEESPACVEQNLMTLLARAEAAILRKPYDVLPIGIVSTERDTDLMNAVASIQPPRNQYQYNVDCLFTLRTRSVESRLNFCLDLSVIDVFRRGDWDH